MHQSVLSNLSGCLLNHLRQPHATLAIALLASGGRPAFISVPPFGLALVPCGHS